MAIDQLALYNAALTRLGDTRLGSVTEKQESRYVLDVFWNEGLVDYCLEQGDWPFAIKTLQMDYSNAIEPSFGYKRAFELPTDFIRLSAVSLNEYFTEGGLTQYAFETNLMFADADQLYVKYVSNDEDYGHNEAKWPRSFYNYVAYEFAAKAVTRITTARATLSDLTSLCDKAKIEALGKAGLSRPTTFPSRGSWNRARHGRYGFSYERNRG